MFEHTSKNTTITILTKKLGYYVPISEIGYETMSLYKEEVDHVLVPPHIIDHLAEPIIANSASYTDSDSYYYLVNIIETGLPQPYEVFLVNEEVVPDFLDWLIDHSRQF